MSEWKIRDGDLPFLSEFPVLYGITDYSDSLWNMTDGELPYKKAFPKLYKFTEAPESVWGIKDGELPYKSSFPEMCGIDIRPDPEPGPYGGDTMIQIYRDYITSGGEMIDMFMDSVYDLPAGGVIDGKQASLGSSAIDVSTGAVYRVTSFGVWINQSTGKKTIQISEQPEDVEVTAGEDAAFTVAASGYSLSYKWQSSSDGTSWSDISGATETTYTLTTEGTDNGKSFRCVITDGDSNSINTDAASLTVNTPPEPEPDPEPEPEPEPDPDPDLEDNPDNTDPSENGEG